MPPKKSQGSGISLEANVQIPDHVVYRAFPAETVVLNLETGKYHGLNPTAGRMLELLDRNGSVRDAAAQLAAEYGQAQSDIERDLGTLCEGLLGRGLVEIQEPEHG